MADAIYGKQWIGDITGYLMLPALVQYVKLWRHIKVDGMQLHTGREDIVSWRWSSCRTYTTRSVYKKFFEGSTRFARRAPSGKLGRRSR